MTSQRGFTLAELLVAARGSGWHCHGSSSSCTAAGSGSRARSASARRSRSRSRCAVADELILIVEDHDKNRKLVRDVLQVKGYRVAEAETGEDGLRLAHELRPALILMDIQLPGISGISVAPIAPQVDGAQYFH